LGAAFLEQPDVFVPDANLVGLLYQLNVLIVPTLAPALLWAWQSRDKPVFMNTFYTNGSSVALDESR
ncbi:MAG: hypothetical protein P8Y92_16195, partial [Halioglobus sp.]